MLKRLMIPVLAATVALTACELTPTGPAAQQVGDDFALVVFGDAGAALEGTMGPQDSSRAFDGRSGRPQLPDSLAFSQAQKDSIKVLRDAFKAAHQSELDALKAIFDRAKAARQAGATHVDVRAILAEGRAIHESLRPAVQALHEAIRAVFTDAQRAWFDAHRPPRGPGGPGRRPGPMGPR